MSYQAIVRALLLVSAMMPGNAHAQGQLPPAMGTPGVTGELRTVVGRVLVGGGDSPTPVNGQMVVLHRISADSSGPVDSINTSSTGAYRFRYRLDGPRSMYIVSARYSGVAYFTTPLREKSVVSPDADVSVFDTTSAAFPLTVRARHVVVAPGEPAGVRRVVDVFEVANDSNRTLVAGAGGATWRITLPAGARDPGSSGGDLPAESFRFVDGRAELLVPVAPGVRQLVLTYAVPATSDVSVAIAEPVANLEVLLEGAGGTIRGAGLIAEAPVTMEGRTFERFRATSVPGGSSFVVSGTGASGRAGRLPLLAVATVAVALGIVLGRRTPKSASSPTRPATDVLAREIATLDRVYQADGPGSGEGIEYYRARRGELIGRLVDAQAVEQREPAT